MHFWKYILKLKRKCEMWDTYLCLPRLRSAMKIQPRPKGGLIPQPARRTGDPGGSAPPHRPALSPACWDLPLCPGNGVGSWMPTHPGVRCSWVPGAAQAPRSGERLSERWPGPPPGRPRQHFAGWACAALHRVRTWPASGGRFLGASDGDKPHCRMFCGDKVF